MIKSKYEKMKTGPVEIDLTGPDGNAFALIGYAKGLAKQLGLDHYKIRNEMIAGDYENLLKIFDKYFGDYVTLYR